MLSIKKGKCQSFSHVWLFVTPWTVACQLLCPGNSPGNNTVVGSHSLLQRIFLTQGLILRLLHCRQTLYHLSHNLSISKHSIKFLFFFFYQVSIWNEIFHFLVGSHIPVLRKLHKGWKVELEEIFTVLSHSAVSNSLWPPWTVAHQAPLSMGILQARILECVAMPSPGNQTQVSRIASRSVIIWATREAQILTSYGY